MNRITLCLPYYRNGGMLARQYAEWAAYPMGIKSAIEVIVVDDGSPENRAIDVARPVGLPPLKLFAMREDVRWNQDACRNLAAAHAANPWLLLTDMDHIVPADTMAQVVLGKLREANVYRFSRVSAPDLQPYKPHPNSWLMTRAMYEAVGGYDERYAGFYGTDAFFRDGVNAALREAGTGAVEMLKQPLIRVPREVIPDASTTTYARKEGRDSDSIRKIRAELATLTPAARRPMRGRFSWDRLL